MNTFQDLRQKLLDLYKEALELYPISDDDYKFTFEPQSGGEDNYSKRIDYFIEEIKNMDEEYQDEFLSLLITYYYASVIQTRKEEELENFVSKDEFIDEDIDLDDEDDEIDEEEELALEEEILKLIKDEEKDVVIEELLSEDNSYLFNMLSLITDFDVETLSEITKRRVKIEDFEEYALFDDLMDIEENFEDQIDDEDAEDEDEESYTTKDDTVKEVYEKYHPNKEAEIKNHQEYIYNDKAMGKLNCLTAKSLADFIEKVVVAKQVFTKTRYFEIFIYNILCNTKIESKENFEKIYLFMIKYYYIKELLQNANDKEKLSMLRTRILSAISSMPSIKMDVVYEFSDFDFYSMMLGNNMLPKEKQDEIDKEVSLDYRITYGIEGKWNEYNEEQDNAIYKYCSAWKSKIDDALKKNYKVQIYYSINEFDCYSIPRLCAITNENNELVEVLGRASDSLVEFEMLKTLEVHSKKYENYEDIKIDINLLNKLKDINNKINNKEELTKEEIEFLFEIECEFPSPLLFRNDTRNKRIQAKTNIKKLFAKYFDCKEEEVAESEKELNENTKVALFDLDITEQTFPYPNLIAVYGTVYLYNIQESESLQNIQYVRYTITAPKLKEKNNIQENLLQKLVEPEETKKKRK